MTKGRPRLFVPRIANEGDLAEYELARNAYTNDANTSQRARVVADFISFDALNACADPCETFRLWVGACRKQGVAWSTIDTYSGYISKVVKYDLSWAQRNAWREIKAVIRAAHADSDTRSAPPCTIDQLKILLPKLSLDTRLGVSAIAFTGCRLRDIRRWRRKQAVLRPKKIAVEVRLTKNRRKRCLRRTLRVNPLRFLGLTTDPALIQVFLHGEPDVRPLEYLSVHAINAELATVCRSLGWMKFTTYSFRKLFIRCVSEKYEYDWSRVVNLTLHTGVDVVAAHYDSLLRDDEEDD